jgi:diguanylate cyclase (GGDEF)-like protein
MLPRPDYSPSLLPWFFLTITFVLVGGITYFSNHITLQAFKHAEAELGERQRAESDLKTVNAELQKHVREVEKLQTELYELAFHDPLTGLYNRRYLNETLPREILRARRNNNCLSILVADIDYFKAINDTYGHQVGDLFLLEIAQLLKRSVRGSDIVCRYGGEEFVLVLLGATVDSAEKRAERLRQECAQLSIQHEGKKLGITMSFGMATYPVHGEQEEEIIMKADHALYDAKRMGRDQVRVWGKPIEL